MYDQLNKLNLCVSVTSTWTALNKLGSNHDVRVKQWRDQLSELLEDHAISV